LCRRQRQRQVRVKRKVQNGGVGQMACAQRQRCRKTGKPPHNQRPAQARMRTNGPHGCSPPPDCKVFMRTASNDTRNAQPRNLQMHAAAQTAVKHAQKRANVICRCPMMILRYFAAVARPYRQRFCYAEFAAAAARRRAPLFQFARWIVTHNGAKSAAFLRFDT